MDGRVVKLTFLAPVHFGDGRLSAGKSTCDAATLFSALFIEALRMGCAEELLSAVNSGDLLISDLFPYVGNGYYLPKPMTAPVDFDEDAGLASERGDSRMKKAFNKLAYIRSSKLGSYLKGSIDPFEELEAFSLGKSALETKVNLERRDSSDAEPYSVGSFFYNAGAGLYFIVQGSFDLAPLMQSLKYSGLGGKRTSGYGRFDFEILDGGPLKDLEGLAREGGDRSLLLSSAMPCESELNDEMLEGARYRIERKGGYVQSAQHASSPQKKRDLYVFSAGSVFKHTFVGGVFDVNATPGTHQVYRYAKAMWARM